MFAVLSARGRQCNGIYLMDDLCHYGRCKTIYWTGKGVIVSTGLAEIGALALRRAQKNEAPGSQFAPEVEGETRLHAGSAQRSHDASFLPSFTRTTMSYPSNTLRMTPTHVRFKPNNNPRDKDKSPKLNGLREVTDIAINNGEMQAEPVRRAPSLRNILTGW
ncbi:hypothetical protein FA13DRAFT_197821 [Coprinellus micaceus]|uniref:Uncharacterized protein n=1 Tax=Coprinellus micaceus TaxID=71717 RepID=A0A4Y7TGG8_COPMI|nr:hypothetical protein FA13DRAFT_197821 [Coprinellus micaceus]